LPQQDVGLITALNELNLKIKMRGPGLDGIPAQEHIQRMSANIHIADSCFKDRPVTGHRKLKKRENDLAIRL
jgi:hypothetical protein